MTTVQAGRAAVNEVDNYFDESGVNLEARGNRFKRATRMGRVAFTAMRGNCYYGRCSDGPRLQKFAKILRRNYLRPYLMPGDSPRVAS